MAQSPIRAVSAIPDEFSVLVTENTRMIYNVCLRIMRNPQDAMDMTQETFLKVWKNRSGFMGQASPGTWMYRIAVNTCLDELRKRKRHETVSIQELSESGWEPVDDEADFASVVVDRETVTAAMSALPEDQRTILLLRESEGCSYDEIASYLKCPVGTVRSRLNRARGHLMKILRGKEPKASDNV